MMNGNSRHKSKKFSENLLNGHGNEASGSSWNGYATISTSSSINSSPSNNYSCSGLNYLEHRVTKMDTLAGVAIKYGVEVADIRRMNGLVTDLQMFALETLRIPCPGRHPPSPIMANGSATNGECTPPPRQRPGDDILDSLQSLKPKPPRRVSPAMTSLQGYYGLATPPKKNPLLEGTEMSVYKTNRSLRLEVAGDPCGTKGFPASEPGLGRHRKSRSLVSLQNGDSITDENGDGSETDKSIIRRRQRADIIDASLQMPETVLKEDSNARGFFGRIGKNLALMSKLDAVAVKYNPTSPIGDFFSDVFVSMRKSSSTSNLQESETATTISSMWPTSKWSLKPDVIARPIFDGLPKSGRRNKAALD